MLKGIDVNEVVEYVSKKDTAENPTVFLVGVLRHSEKLSIFGDAVTEKGEVDVRKILQEKLVPVITAGLKGIRNFDGKDYSQGEITKDLIDRIDFDVVTEILEQVIAHNFPTENERKN